MKRTKNPHDRKSDLFMAWESGRSVGWTDRQRATSEGLKEAQDESGYMHPECEDCTVQIKKIHGVKLMLQLSYVGDKPDAGDIAEALSEALPKEWWVDHAQADWGVVMIVPLTDEGHTRVGKF